MVAVSNTATWELFDGEYELSLSPNDDGSLEVEVREAGGDEDLVWADTKPRRFWTSGTHKGQVKNDLAPQLDDYSKADVKAELTSVWTDLQAHDKEYEENLLAPAVEEVISSTQDVVVYRSGDKTQVHVYVTGQQHGTPRNGTASDGGATQEKFVFDSSEWTKDSGDTTKPPVVQKYHEKFFRTLDISWEQWANDIRPRWEDAQEFVNADPQTAEEQLAHMAVRDLARLCDWYADAEQAITDTMQGLYREDWKGYEEAIWIPKETMLEVLQDYDKGGDDLSTLSPTLMEQDLTLGKVEQTSINSETVYLYPFDLETLNVDKLDIHGLDLDEDDDDDGDEGEAGDESDDGGDGGGAGESATTDDTDEADSGGEAPSAQARDDLSETAESVVDHLERETGGGRALPEPEIVATLASRDGLDPESLGDAIDEGVSTGWLVRDDDGVRLPSNFDSGDDGPPAPGDGGVEP